MLVLFLFSFIFFFAYLRDPFALIFDGKKEYINLTYVISHILHNRTSDKAFIVLDR